MPPISEILRPVTVLTTATRAALLSATYARPAAVSTTLPIGCVLGTAMRFAALVVVAFMPTTVMPLASELLTTN